MEMFDNIGRVDFYCRYSSGHVAPCAHRSAESSQPTDPVDQSELTTKLCHQLG